MSVLPISGWSKRARAILAAAGIASALALWYFATRLPPIPQRPLRIGFEHNPPVQIRTGSGLTGLAVETINEAAKRAGVRLQWVETGTSSDEAFRKGLVDLWPLMADLPDRRKRVHITRPWLHSSHALILRAGSVSPDPGFTVRIALFKMPLHARLLRKQFPGVQPVEFPEPEEVVREVCRGTVDAGFLEGRVALAALREKPADCAPVALRVQTLPDLTLQHGVASTFAAAGAAEAIRREIGNMFRDGSLAVTIAKYSYYGLDDTWASYDLMEAAERARWMAWGISALGVALTVLLWRSFALRQRKRAGAALRESEERFRATFFQAAVGIAQTGLAGKWLLLNDRFCEILGYTQAELRGKTFLDITHPDDREASLGATRRLLAGEISSHSMDKRYVRKDGAIVWARLWVSLVRDPENLPRYFISIIEDVTKRIQADRALRDSEQRLMLAQSAAHMGIWERDLRTNVKTISGEYAKLYALAPDRPVLMYEEWLSLIHPDDRERLQTHIRESIERTGSWDTEFRVVWPDGSIHWLLTKGTVLLDDSGQPVRRVGVNLDITERKQAEAALRESEQRFRNMADAAPVMIWVSGPDKRLTFFNRTWLDFTGRTLQQELGNGWAEGVHPEDRDRCVASFCSSFDARQDFQIEHRLRRADGEYRWVLCKGVPRFAAGGVFAGYIGSDIDVTDQQRAEATLRRSLDEIAHLNRVAAMGELTASIAHELNQPLAAILSNAQAANRFLNGQSPDLAEVRACLTDIVADDKRAGEVIKRLRRLLKKNEFQASVVDLNEVVGDVIRLIRNDALLRGASVAFEPCPGLPPVLGDRIQLYQVVLNLTVNGLEATAEQPAGARWLSVRTAESDGGDVLLTVRDSGKGIANSDLVRVFEPFFTTKQEGLGMGLSISRSIVQVHGGRIWAENSAGGGATFQCVLPAAQQMVAAAAR